MNVEHEWWSIEGKKRFAAALLEDVVHVLLAYPPASEVYLEAVGWVRGEGSGISFELACAVLDLDPDVLRPRLEQMPGAQPTEARQADGVFWHAHTCGVCGRTFVSGVLRQLYCTDICMRRAYRARKRDRRRRGVWGMERTIPKVCGTCGKDFLARLDWAKYCSTPCAVRGPRKEHGSDFRYRQYLAARRRERGVA